MASPSLHPPLRSTRIAAVAAVIVAAAGFLAIGTASAAQPPVGLGTATSFAVLAGSGITNTGATTINGDVGTFPTTTESGFASVTIVGTNQGGNSVTQGAKTDLIAAYNDAAGRTPVTNVPTELGGTTKLPGVYANGTFGITNTLTLDAKGDASAVFIFQTETTLVTAVDSQVLFINGANPCNVFWKIGSSATFGTRTSFVGTVMASESITANNGATFLGRLLARTSAVTLDHNTITRGNCDALPTIDTTTTTAAPTTSSTAITGGTGASLTGTGGSTTGSGSGTTGTGRGTTSSGTSRNSTPGLAVTGHGLAALTLAGLAMVTLGLTFLLPGRRPQPEDAVANPWPPRYDWSSEAK
jgi:type VI secretion system secreted protein VgrG